MSETLFTKDQSKAVRQAMQARCNEQGHEWENCCSVMFEIYKKCKWCGETKKSLREVYNYE